MANTLTLSSLIAMYEGVLQFTDGVSRRWLLWFLAFTSFSVVYFNTEVHRNLAACIVSLALVMAAVRGFTAFALFKRSIISTQRAALRFFGLFLTTMGAISVRLAWQVYAHGLPNGTTEASAEGVLMRSTGMVYLAISGLCFLVLTSRELVSRRRVEGYRDRLTGTFDREGLELSLAIEMERSSRSGLPFSIGLVQVDQLTRILEAQGRAGGNVTLREVAEAIAGQLRNTDQVGRFSGDLFLMVLSQTTHLEALIVAERVAGKAGQLKLLTDSHAITLSIGITESATGDTGEQMIARAEGALSLAATAGRNCCRVVLGERTGTLPVDDARVSALA